MWDQAPRPPGTRNHETGGVWVFRTVCFERVVLSSPGRLRPGRMDDHEEVSKHTPEQIVVKLKKAEQLRGEGMSTAHARRVLGISEATLCRWRQRYGSMNRCQGQGTA